MSLKYKIVIIVTWFGELPAYFPAWLMSAEYNKDVDFLIFSDHKISSKSENIQFQYMTLEDSIRLFEEKLHRKIWIKNSYKFCDCRAFFGIAYEDFLKGYDFWGYCDIDLMFGNIRRFLTDDVLERYDRFYPYGHLSIFRNTERINRLYQLPGARYSEKEVFEKAAKTTFEEHLGLNRICRKNGIKWYVKTDFADFAMRYPDRLEMKHGKKNYEKQIFVWDGGEAFLVFEKKGRVKKRPLVYMHWQKRKPVFIADSESRQYAVFADRITSANIKEMSDIEELFLSNKALTGKEKQKFSRKYYIRKMKDFFRSDAGTKCMWLRQKLDMIFERDKGYR